MVLECVEMVGLVCEVYDFLLWLWILNGMWCGDLGWYFDFVSLMKLEWV